MFKCGKQKHLVSLSCIWYPLNLFHTTAKYLGNSKINNYNLSCQQCATPKHIIKRSFPRASVLKPTTTLNYPFKLSDDNYYYLLITYLFKWP